MDEVNLSPETQPNALKYHALWRLIASGALPEDVRILVGADNGNLYIVTGDLDCFVDQSDPDTNYRTAGMLLVDAWEKQGKRFQRNWGQLFDEKQDKNTFQLIWSEKQSGMSGWYAYDEILSLLRCLARVGGKTPEQIEEVLT